MGEVVEELVPHTVPVGIQVGAAALANIVALPEKVKHRVTVSCSSSTTSYICKRNENVCPYKNMYINVHCNIVRNSPTLETTQMFTHR